MCGCDEEAAGPAFGAALGACADAEVLAIRELSRTTDASLPIARLTLILKVRLHKLISGKRLGPTGTHDSAWGNSEST
jgi:hypothetical protein